MWPESQPGPSSCQPSRRGYCGYCRVLYGNLEQHLSSLRHMDSVRASSRSCSSTSTKCSLLERFLQDVLQHHPHHYSDPRPPPADLTLPPADLTLPSAPLLPRAELDELNRCLLERRWDTPTSEDSSCELANQKKDGGVCSRVEKDEGQKSVSDPITEQDKGETALTPEAHTHSAPSVHRKAHRKTNRRKNKDSSPSSPPHSGPGPRPHTHLRPWLSWQKERREVQKEEAFSSDHSDPVNETIEEVIHKCCHGFSSTPGQQEDTDSLHLVLDSLKSQSEDWDSPVQAVLQLDTHPSHTPVQTSRSEGRGHSCLMDMQVDIEDQFYSYQLDSVLHSERRAVGGAWQEQGYRTLPIEKILPVPAHIPESFMGKTWPQIEQEDEKKVERLVRQFNRAKFLCYFDSESLARFGRRSQEKTRRRHESDTGILPLLVHDEDDPLYISKYRRGRSFRMASRCQVVKVSHSTQTVQLVVPAVRQPALEALPLNIHPASRNSAEIPSERTPEAPTPGNLWRLPPSYSHIITPLQPRTSLVYLLCSPSSPVPKHSSLTGSASKRCRRKKRPMDHVVRGLKVKYKRLPFKFYDPNRNRILQNAPKGSRWHCSSAPTNKPTPACVRQLFRSLSPDLNTERLAGEGGREQKSATGCSASGSSKVKGPRPSDIGLLSATTLPFSQSNGSHFLRGTLGRSPAQPPKQEAGRKRGRTRQTPPPPRAGRPVRGVQSTTPQASKRGVDREAVTPPQSRRKSLRRAGHPGPVSPLHPAPRRERSRRGRR
ncbi:DBF4-type zinc finger-containing protein 2 isoform X2 [Genypterus blacodes]